jgi:DNA-binding transcriptional ArsR family regulator
MSIIWLSVNTGSMGEKEWEASNIFDVFGDRLSRQILVLASSKSLAADDLASRLDVSEPTVYRRLNTLRDYDLLRVDHQIQANGNNYKTFETTLKRVAFEIEDGGYTIDLQVRQNLADQFESFWTSLDGPTERASDQSNRVPNPDQQDS